MFTSALSTLGFGQNNKMMSSFLDKNVLSRNPQEKYDGGPTKR